MEGCFTARVARTTFGPACAVIHVILSMACTGEPVRELTRSGRATPLWRDASIPVVAPEPPPEPEGIEVHLDISAPMAGFLPPASRRDQPAVLRTTAQNVASHLARVFGGGGIAVRWRTIGHELRSLPGTPRIERTLFDGRWSRLTLSIERILADFRSGRVEAAALVSDLMATGDITGPLAVSDALADWLASDDVRSGTFHVGLLGMRADYRGWHSAGCPRRSDELGCVHDERAGLITPLAGVVKIPFYVLVLGRGIEQVEDVIESVRRGIEELEPDGEVKYEILTQRSDTGVDTELFCTAAEQYALYYDKDDSGPVSCHTNAPVSMRCRLSNGIALTSAAVEVRGEATELPSAAELRQVPGDALGLDIRCAELRDPSERMNMRLTDVVGGVTHQWHIDWSEWSTETDELGKTLQLEGFVRELRIVPDAYRVDLQQPILEFGAR